MGLQVRLLAVTGVVAVSVASLGACKPAPPAAPAQARSVTDLLANVPAEAQVFWAADFQSGLDALVGFAAAVGDGQAGGNANANGGANAPATPGISANANIPNDANALVRLQAFAARAGVDLRTARGWNALGIDTGEGVAVLAAGLSPPTFVVRTRDLVRLDKFINLYAETRSETEGHAIGNVHGNTVHSYRNVHWSHVGGYTWFTVGRSGRVAMAHMLQHIHREDGVIAPTHPVSADANFARDMNHVRKTAWMGRGHVAPLMRSGSDVWTMSLDLTPQGFACQAFVDGPLKPLPADATALDALVRRYNPHDLLFSAGRYMDFNYAARPIPPARPPSQTARTAPHPTGMPEPDPAGADPVQAIDHFITRATGLHWREDVVPSIRGVTLGVALVPEGASWEGLQAAITIDVSDPGKAAGWLATAAQTMAQQNLLLKPAVQTVHGTAFTTYHAESGPWPPVPGNNHRWVFNAAVVGKSVVLAVGADAFSTMANTLLSPQPPASPWLAQESWTTRGTRAHGYTVVRLRRVADIAARWSDVTSPNATFPINPGPIEKSMLAPALHVLSRIGDVVATAIEVPDGQMLEWSSNFTSLPSAADATPGGDASQQVLQPGAQSAHQNGATQSRDTAGKDHPRLEPIRQHRKQQRYHKAADYK